jgi:hypothetical protein
MSEYQNIVELLQWMAGPIGIIWWATEWSDLIRNIREGYSRYTKGTVLYKLGAWFHAMSAARIQAVVVSGYLALPIVIVLVLNYASEEWLASLQPIWEYCTFLFAGLLSLKYWFNKQK